jgi:hypothetical protein
MNHEGNLHLVWMNRGLHGNLECNVMFADYGASGVMKPRKVIGERALRQFLTGRAHVRSGLVDAILKELHETGIAGLDHVLLSDDELLDLGLK